jgi:PiT family inorganic phosphate transporter
MLTNLDPASALAIGLLIFSLVMVIAFEATNGFHDAANAVATVIYTKSLTPVQAVLLSGVMNFLGVLVGGIAVAYALVELLPPEVLSPPGGGPAVAMLVSLFLAALSWNLLTWWFALPNSSSHCLIGALVGIAVGNAVIQARSLSEGVRWAQLWRCSRGSPSRRSWASCWPARFISRRVGPSVTAISMSRSARSRRSGGCAAF